VVAFLGAIAAVGFVYLSPVILLGACAAVVVAGLCAGAGRAIRAGFRHALPLLVVMIVINGLVYHRGETVLVRGWVLPVLGDTDVTLESLVYGGAIGLRVVVAVLAFAVYSACVDPDRVLRALRPVARRSALTAALVTRLVPLAAADAGRLREAATLRGPGASEAGRPALARRLVEGSLDRAIDVAATLELRGHSLPGRAAQRRRPSRDDAPVLISAMLIAAVTVAGAIGGVGGFEVYPEIELSLDPLTLGLTAALPALATAPFAWRYLRETWERRLSRRLEMARA
jgi:energy-coupling factor transport system permease protein